MTSPKQHGQDKGQGRGVSDVPWTLGKWSIHSGNVGATHILAGKYRYSPRWRGTGNIAEQEANARLIAAAPEMVEALRMLSAEMHTMDDEAVCDHNAGICWCSWNARLQSADALLSRIRGETA